MQFTLSEQARDYEQILALQGLNHADAIGHAADGFVSLTHTVALLHAVRGPYRHVIAREGDVLAGYALVMQRDSGALFPELGPMFATAERGLGVQPFFVMGQVCVAQAFRGKGVFDGLYAALRAQMREHFPLVVTEVAKVNTRSMDAHRRVGFRPLASNDPASEWVVVAWDWGKS
jgi:predicted GNAT superfamily acetyltransferase